MIVILKLLFITAVQNIKPFINCSGWIKMVRARDRFQFEKNCFRVRERPSIR